MCLRRFVNPINLVIGCAIALAVVLFLGGCGKSNTAYNPNPLNISKGTTVSWTNSDSITHTATSDTPGMFDTSNISAGAKSNAITFSTTGTFHYHCSIHPNMIATINVQ